MQFTVKRENLLKPLHQVISSLSGRPSLPILGNLLLQVSEDRLSMTSTDLEMEIVTRVRIFHTQDEGETTVPGRKFFDICRGLPEGSEIFFKLEGDRMIVRSGRSRFSLATFPASDFPNLEDWQSKIEFTILQRMMKQLIEETKFSMANQDARYYLNGMLLETEGKELRTVATDGHRLALSSVLIDYVLPSYSAIVPRKGINELTRMIDDNDIPLHIQLDRNNIRVHVNGCIFTSKLLDGRFPDYRHVLLNNPDKILEIGRNSLKQAISRVAILSNEKFRGVHMKITRNQVKITTSNANQEEAEEILDAIYIGDEIEIAFNASYLLDVLQALKCENIRLLLTDSISSVQIESAVSRSAIYIVMPIRI